MKSTQKVEYSKVLFNFQQFALKTSVNKQKQNQLSVSQQTLCPTRTNLSYNSNSEHTLLDSG